jgi:hypothetical protein
VSALEADITYAIKLADSAYEEEIAYDAVYNEPEPNGYVNNILIF